MLDQAEMLRRLARERQKIEEDICKNYKGPEKSIFEASFEEKTDKNFVKKRSTRIITITSGKGGVGKSNLVVNLAIALGSMGKKVLILDADVGMANDDILMGCLPKYDISDVIINNMDVEDILISGPKGVKLLPGGSGITKLELLSKEKRYKFIEKVSCLEDFDFIFMDTGAGASERVLDYIASCNELIVVTTPEPTSLTDAYGLLKIVNNLNIKSSAKLIVNKSLNVKEALATYSKFKNTVDKFLHIKLDYLGYVLRDTTVEEAVRAQKPFLIKTPNGIASKNILSIANSIIGNKEQQASGIKEFFTKVFHIFS